MIWHRRPTALKLIKKDLHYNPSKKPITFQETQIIQDIVNETKRKNINNITRTNAYLDFYMQHSEIDWAFLAHMVSRNTGWNMTDLKGSYLTKLLTSQEQDDYFAFLERANWLIFQDAYPQLLLYQESFKRHTNLFHLLPAFGVSYFMEVLWNYFYQHQDNYLITNALIINEQSYIEKRVIQHASYQTTILKTLAFKLQHLLHLNHILFPYHEETVIKFSGQSVPHFASLHKRILLGKKLYQLLFNDKHYSSIYHWALQHPHTGSRKDFWPHLFQAMNDDGYIPTTKKGQLDANSPRIFSPTLIDTWSNSVQQPAEIGDWYSNYKVINYLNKQNKKENGNIMKEYCKSIEKLQFAAQIKETFS